MSGSNLDRRTFLKATCCTLAGGAAAGTFSRLQALHALGAPAAEYRALVCVFLNGGNDALNMVVPTGASEHAVYAASRSAMALDRATLLPLTFERPIGTDLGMHPSAPELRALFDAGRLAILANVGSLIRPMTKAQYQSGSVTRPPHLFSHSDQQYQWFTAVADGRGGQGFAGRIADVVRSLNTNQTLSPNIALGRSNVTLVGSTVLPYVISANGAERLSYSGSYGTVRQAGMSDLLGMRLGHELEKEYQRMLKESVDLEVSVTAALAGAPALATAFPATGLGRDLQMVARLISARDTLLMSRQIFFVNFGGFDTHSDQLDDHATLLQTLSQALHAFQAAMAELGVENNVTAFTMSDFGRTLSSNGTGTDHGWGGHALVLGGAVDGANVYGTMPSLQLGSSDDVGGGRLLPTTSVDQYVATLARWFGVPVGQLPTLLPNLGNFGTQDLGFLV